MPATSSAVEQTMDLFGVRQTRSQLAVLAAQQLPHRSPRPIACTQRERSTGLWQVFHSVELATPAEGLGLSSVGRAEGCVFSLARG